MSTTATIAKVIEGAPDLIMEIVSPRSADRDRREKFTDYEAAGVREYWIIDRFRRTMTVVQYGRGTPMERVVEDGQDLASRGQMQIAALLAGWAFSNAMVGLVHAMAHSLGAVCGVPHGLANGLILPHVMDFNLSETPELIADVGEAMGVAVHGLSTRAAGEAAVKQMSSFVSQIGLSQRLRDLGVPEQALPQCAELSLSDGSIIYNPRIVMEADEVLEVYRKVY